MKGATASADVTADTTSMAYTASGVFVDMSIMLKGLPYIWTEDINIKQILDACLLPKNARECVSGSWSETKVEFLNDCQIVQMLK